MLDDRIVALAKKTIAAQSKDMDEPLAVRVNTIKAQMHGNGRLFIYVLKTYEDEIKARAQVIWRNIQRAHSSIGASRYDSLQHDLLYAFLSEIDSVVVTLAPLLDRDMGGCPTGFHYQVTFGDARNHEVARHEAEIEHYVASLESAIARGAQVAGAYNFYGSVGAVMTGPGAVANVVQNIGTEQQKALVEALEFARAALDAAPELQSRDKIELVEIVNGTVDEVKRERPNTRRLSQALQNIAAAVQGIASGGQAYEAIRTAAIAIGIPL